MVYFKINKYLISRHFILNNRYITNNSKNKINPLFKKILIANRGEIACRIHRTIKELNITSVAIYSEVDKYAQHVKMADESYYLGGVSSAPNETYLNYTKIIDICKKNDIDAIHPGYGFLSENSKFAEECEQNGITFIGPPTAAIKAMGSKRTSKEIMIKAGVPVIPGYHGEDQDVNTLTVEAIKMGFPVLIKAVHGGGGKGMRIVFDEHDIKSSIESCIREAKTSFNSSQVIIEKYLVNPRHIEFQIFGDKHGNVCHFFERDCSVQRRHQKILEEAPAPGLNDDLRQKMGASAVAAAKAVSYVGAGTVEFMLDANNKYYFMEMNTRLQVEHPITELVTKTDLVKLQIKVAAGLELPRKQEHIHCSGHAIEARIYAENPYNQFLPCTGKLLHLGTPQLGFDVNLKGITRLDTGVIQGDEVSIYYDPMVAKLVAYSDSYASDSDNRQEAIKRLRKALKEYQKHSESLLKPFTNPANDIYALAVSILLLLERKTLNENQWSKHSANDQLSNFRLSDTFKRKVNMLKNQNEKIECKIIYKESERKNSNHAFDIGIMDEVYSVKGDIIKESGDFNIIMNTHRYEGTAIIDKQTLNLFISNVNGKINHLVYKYSLDIPVYDDEFVDKKAFGNNNTYQNVVSPMPGKIIKYMVNENDKVEANQPLLVLEAMKMEHLIRSPGKGIVKKIYQKGGDFVSDGIILLELRQN